MKHKYVFILAILVGVIIVSPYFYFRYYSDAYQGISLGGADEEAYLTRVQEVRDEHYATANYVWAEGKDLPYLVPPLSEMMVSFLGNAFDLDIADTAVLARFVFPIIIFLLIYIFIFQLTGKKLIASLASITVLLATNIISINALLNLILKQEAYTDFLPFSRLVAPPVHLIFFFGFLLFFWFFLKKEKIIYATLSGIVLGLSFYTYPYTWTFLFAFLGCFFLISFFRRDYFKIKIITCIALLALIEALPYLYNLYQATQHPLYTEISFRHGLIKSHQPQIGYITIILAISFLLFFFRQDRQRYYYCLALVLTPLVVLNQQIVTGMTMIPDHYHWYYHKPLLVIFVFIILFEQLEKRIKKNFSKKIIIFILSVLILSLVFYNVIMVQYASYQYRKPIATYNNQYYSNVLKWLNNNAKKDEVVMGNDIISYLVPIYTSLNGLATEDGHYSLIASEEQITERFFLGLRLDGPTKKEAKEFFFKNKRWISAEIYGQLYRKKFGDYGNIPDEKLEFVIGKYIEFLDMPLNQTFKKYNTDYLIWDTVKDPNWRIDRYSFFELIYQDERVKLYRLL